MLCADIFRSVSGRLQDEDSSYRRWPWESSEETYGLPDALNAAIREITAQRPDASAETRDLAITAGSLRQALPADCSCLIDMVCNRKPVAGQTGLRDGRPIYRVGMDALRTCTRYETVTGAAVENFAYAREDNAREFYVYPALTDGGTVRAVVSAIPPKVTASTDTFPLPDSYANAAIYYMLYDLLSGDTSDSDTAKAAGFYQMFTTALGAKLQTDMNYPMKNGG